MIEAGGILDDRYELRRRLGAGGMGAVYVAFDRRLERDVAIKSLLPEHAGHGELLSRFMREARALAGVRHPNIVTLHDLLTLDEGVFLVLELVPGRSLEEEIRREGPLSWARCADLGTQVCGGLAAIHARDVIHRDIKPSNILIEPTGVARVADFGLARLADVTRMTRTGAGMGTPGYWAPEQALGDPTDGRADLYSLGAVLFAAATGAPPLVIESDSPAAVLASLMRPAPDPRDLVPDLPDAAAEVVMRAMARNPDDRFASAVEMARALRASAGLPLNFATPVPPAETLPPADAPTAHAQTRVATEVATPSRGPRRMVGAGIALVAVAAVAGLGLGSMRDGGTTGALETDGRMTGGAGSIGVPIGWSYAPGGGPLGEMLRAGATARPTPGAEESLAMGTTDAAGPTFLPARLLTRLTAVPGRPDRVRIGTLQGYRYRGLPLAGGDLLTVIVVPTTAGAVQTIACSAPPGRFAAFDPLCQAAAGTLTLARGNDGIRLGPRRAYASAVGAVVERLNDTVPSLRRELAEASVREAQADAAGEIAAAYSAAADDLRSRRPGAEANGLNAALVDALDAADAAYAGLAAATTSDAAFAAARDAVSGAEDEVRRALRALGRGGYEVVSP